MWIKTKDSQLINLDNLVVICIHNKYAGSDNFTQSIQDKIVYEVKANDVTESMQYVLGRFDTEELAKKFINDITKGIEEEWQVMEVF